jgi:NAD-dependent deacetylase
MQVLKATPHAGHLAVAELASYTDRLTVITQNVDDLHERAGSRGVTHLHGSLHKPRCFNCGSPYSFPAGIPDEPEGGRRVEPPVCSECHGPIRPGIVWFGEQSPHQNGTERSKRLWSAIFFSASALRL